MILSLSTPSFMGTALNIYVKSELSEPVTAAGLINRRQQKAIALYCTDLKTHKEVSRKINDTLNIFLDTLWHI